MPEGYDILEAEEPAGYEILEPEETPSALPQEPASVLTERRLTPSETAKIASVRAQLEARARPTEFEAPSLEPVMTPGERERIAAVRERVELPGYIRRITHPVQTGLTESAIGAAEAMRSPSGMGLLGATVAAPEAMAPVWVGMGVHGMQETVPQIHRAIQEGDRPAYWRGVFDLGQQALMAAGGLHGMAPRPPVPLPRTMRALAEEPLVEAPPTITPTEEVPSAVQIEVPESVLPSMRPQPGEGAEALPTTPSPEGIRGGPPTEEGTGRAEVPMTEAEQRRARTEATLAAAGEQPAAEEMTSAERRARTEATLAQVQQPLSPTIESLQRELEHLQGGEVTEASLARASQITRELEALRPSAALQVSAEAQAKAQAEAPSTGGMPLEDVKSIAGEISGRLPGAPTIKVIKSIDELPTEHRSQIQSELEAGRIRRGFYDPNTDTAWLISNHLQNAEQARAVAMEEVLGHTGMTRLLKSGDYQELFNDIQRFKPTEAATIARDYRLNLENETDRQTLVNEYVAKQAHLLPATDPVWQRVKDVLLRAFGRIGLTHVEQLSSRYGAAVLDARMRALAKTAAGQLSARRAERLRQSTPRGDILPLIFSHEEVTPIEQGTQLVGEGPGAAPLGFGSYPAVQQLADQLKAAPKVGTRERLAWGERKAALWAEGKDLVTKATAGVANVTQTIKDIGRGVTTVTGLERRLGEYDWAIQQSAGMSKNMRKAMERQMRSKTDREAAAVLIDTARTLTDPHNPAEMRQAIADALANMPRDTNPAVRRAFERALDPTLELRQFTESLKQYFGLREQDAINGDLFAEGLKDYYTHIWQKESNFPAKLVTAFTSGKVSTYFRFGRQREIPTFIDGIMEGKTPVLDPAEIVPHYNYSMDRAIASRELVKQFSDLKAKDGRPLVEPLGGSASPDPTSGPVLIKPKIKPADIQDYKAVDHPAMRKWKWVQTVDDRPVVVQGDLVVHPEAYERLARMMDRTRLTPSDTMRTALKIGAEIKGLKLGAIPSLFHPLHVGSHGLLHWTNPFSFKGRKWMSEGAINWEHPFTRFAVEQGHLKLAVNPHELSIFTEGLANAPWARSLGNLLTGPVKFGDIAHNFSSWLFEDYIPKLKLATFENAWNRAQWAQDKLGLFKGLGRAELAARTGESANYAYGELNHLFLGPKGRSPGLQRALRLGFLAPDFGESRLRFVLKAFTKYGWEERFALATLAGAAYTAVRVANYISHGNAEMDPKNAFRIKVGSKWYTARSVAGDVIHALTNTRQFIYVRLNPITSQRIWDLASGRDVNTGRKLTWGDQLTRTAETAMPLQFSGLTRDDQTFLEGLSGSMGVSIQRDQPEMDVKKLALEWNSANGHPPPAEFVPNDTPNFFKMRLALRLGRTSAAASMMNDLRKTRSEKQIEHAMAEYVEYPFTGSNEREKLFITSLTQEQARLYLKARDERMNDLAAYFRMLGQNPRK